MTARRPGLDVDLGAVECGVLWVQLPILPRRWVRPRPLGLAGGGGELHTQTDLHVANDEGDGRDFFFIFAFPDHAKKRSCRTNDQCTQTICTFDWQELLSYFIQPLILWDVPRVK